MFNIGSAELILILLVAFVIVGPKDLPKVARALARGVRYLQNLFQDFKDETGLEDTLKDLKETEKDLNATLQDADPMKELRQVRRDTETILRDTEKAAKAGPGASK
ncbi:hypothetical protein FACS1894196_1630 [Clostridia bacterium]|nr:hypothetical protein FACS1894196_1630 [Clostridia bacterium]